MKISHRIMQGADHLIFERKGYGFQILGPWQKISCEFLDVRTTGMHSIFCVISMDLPVCHKQIAEEWRQQIIVVAKQKFSSIERIDLEISRISNLENRGAVCAR